MPVDTRSPSREAMHPTWQRCRTAHEGGDAVARFDLDRAGKGAVMVPNDLPGWWFLPPRPKMFWWQYRTYHRLALWSGITRRTADGLVGVLFREDPVMVGVAEDLAADVTGTGRDAKQLAADAARELLLAGQVTMLADFPEGPDGNPIDRPTLAILPAESILEMRLEHGPDGVRPTLLRVAGEALVPDPKDPWKPKKVQRVSVLRIVDGVYTVEIFEKQGDDAGMAFGQSAGEDAGKGAWKSIKTVTPGPVGKTLDALPVVTAMIEDADDAEPPPPLAGVVALETDHYRLRAAQALCLHTVLPTLVVTGSKMTDEQAGDIQLGVRTILSFPGSDVKAAFVGLGSDDLAGIENRLTQTEELISKMGARMLMAPPKAGVEAAETIRLRQTGEASTMIQLAEATDRVMTAALGWLVRLSAGAGDGSGVEFDVDRTTLSVDPSRIDRLIQLFDANLIPRVMVLAELQGMHAIPDDMKPEEIDELIKANAPDMVGSNPAADDADDGDDGGDDDNKPGKGGRGPGGPTSKPGD